jgi:hypothetical protein
VAFLYSDDDQRTKPLFYLLKEREIVESQDKDASETENVHSSNP